jgi:hypothetical protein
VKRFDSTYYIDRLKLANAYYQSHRLTQVGLRLVICLIPDWLIVD